MPAATTTIATVRNDLSDAVMAFDLLANQANFIGHQIFRPLNVASKAGTYPKVSLDQLLQDGDVTRSQYSGFNRGNWTFTPTTYAVKNYGWEEMIDDDEAQMYADFFDAEVMAAQRAQHMVMLKAEMRIAAAVFNTSTYTATSITNEWDDFTNAVPVDDVIAAQKRVFAASGLWPNSLIINRSVFLNLRGCDQIRDRVASSGAGDSTLVRKITAQQVAEALDLDHVLVAGGAKNSANEGQTASPGHIWSDEYAMVCKTAETNDPREPCIGRTFHWAGNGSSETGRIETYRDEPVMADITRARHDVSEVNIFTETAELLDNVTT